MMLMPQNTERKESPFSETHWKSLRYFNYYRFCLALILLASSLFGSPEFSILGTGIGTFHRTVSGLYLLATILSLTGLRLVHQHFNLQLSLQVLTDILVLILLMHVSGGVRSGLGAMLLVTLVAAGLVGQGRLVLFYAAMATLSMLFEQTWRAIHSDFEVVDFFQAGLFSAACFGVAISARLLGLRIFAHEELARQRGIDLKNQMLISQRIIEEMQDGVLVIERDGSVRQRNPRAERLLGLSDPSTRMLGNYSTELASRFADWCARGTNDPVLVRAPASGMHLSARFVPTDSTGRDVLVFLEDTERLQEQARQIKLAALGRLTANIAHEIRNPLSAIRHASELLGEGSQDPTGERLLRIIMDNTLRVGRIVSDVLELGRRDRTHRELIDLRQALPQFIDEYLLKEQISPGLLQLELSGSARLYFDRSHFYQVLSNLTGNALRHSQQQEGSIRLLVRDSIHEGWVDLSIQDDGQGVDEAHREHVFEPIITTHHQGTGLGLYIARELCEANGARLELRHSEAGALFCISGRNECQ